METANVLTNERLGQSDKPALSVVIPCCNGERHLPACLESLSRQTFRDFEVRVVENGSEDRTAEIVTTDFPWVELHRLKGKQGFSRPVNVGWQAARADWIFLLNDDTVCSDDCLEKLWVGIKEHPEADFFAALMVFFDSPDVVNSAGHRLMCNATVVERGIGEPVGETYQQPYEVFGACAGAALYHRWLLEQLGGFDEDFWIINEDVDFDFRAQLHGATCVFNPAAVVRHRGSQFMGSGSPRMIHAYVKNLGGYLVKDIPPQFWRRYRVQILLHLWKSSSALVREGRFLTLAKARWDFLKLAPLMLRKRREQMDQLLRRGAELGKWADTDTGDLIENGGKRQTSPPGRLSRNLAPGLVSLVLLVPLLCWLVCTALHDGWYMRKSIRKTISTAASM